MKGVDEFTQEQIIKIETLIKEKESVFPARQKSIRNQIRKIGFYWSDFYPQNTVVYNTENFRKLISDGRIKITDKIDAESIFKDNTLQVVDSDSRSSMTNQNYKEGLLPWVGESPKVLILGSMPGDESIRQQAYYSNISHNSFWKIMYSLFMKEGTQYNKEFITSHHIALWDCIQSGVRKGSVDNGFDDCSVVPNDLESFLAKYPTIKTIVLNGKGTPAEYYRRFFSNIKIGNLIKLNSTSNACTISFDAKLKEWSVIKELIE